ncbi:MAG: hypothetical protein AB7G28_19155 [Pirellulales bacterium]
MRIALFCGFLSLAMLACRSSEGSILGPSAYVGFADSSPFAAVAFDQFYLEDFEDGLNVPGVSASSGQTLNFGTLRDSVDEDDGSIDGSGLVGFSWYVTTSTFSFSFDANVLGALPTHAGVVLTDIGYDDDGSIGKGTVKFEAFGPGNVSLGTVGPIDFGDGLANGGTAEDRFLGVYDVGGISRISLTLNSSDWELDHLQYGIASSTVTTTPAQLPELASSSVWVVGLGAVFLGPKRRKRHARLSLLN